MKEPWVNQKGDATTHRKREYKKATLSFRSLYPFERETEKKPPRVILFHTIRRVE